MTIAMALLVVAATLFTGHFQVKPFDIGDYSQVDIEAAKAQFAAEPSNENLVLLCKALSWRIEVAGDENAKEQLKEYGQQLLERAKAETVDLEKVDDPEVMLAVLRVIRETGAR